MKNVLILLALLLSTIAPTQPAAAAEPPFKIIAGDVLQISVWKEDELNREIVVLPNGDITFPLIGTVMAQGLSPAELQDIIKQKLKTYIPDASVSVLVKAALGHSVNVIGEVNRPGQIVMNQRMTTMQALSQAGGLTPFASEGSIVVIRRTGDKEISISIPYDDIASGDELEKNIPLEPGDVIVVPTASLL